MLQLLAKSPWFHHVFYCFFLSGCLRELRISLARSADTRYTSRVRCKGTFFSASSTQNLPPKSGVESSASRRYQQLIAVHSFLKNIEPECRRLSILPNTYIPRVYSLLIETLDAPLVLLICGSQASDRKSELNPPQRSSTVRKGKQVSCRVFRRVLR